MILFNCQNQPNSRRQNNLIFLLPAWQKEFKRMPTYIIPGSDRQRRYQLNEAAAQAQRDQTNGSALLSPERTAALAALAQTFSQMLDDRLVAVQTVSIKRRALTTAVTLMKIELKQAWTAVRANVVSGVWPESTAAYYAIPTSESVDYPTTPKQWLQAGLNTVHGNTLAGDQGVGGLLNSPQLQAACETAVAALTELQTAEEALVEARQAVIAQRPACDDMLKLVMGDLRNSARLQSPVEMRRLLRAYGGRFRFRQNEPAEGEETRDDLPLAV
jgi:hypothetical protein